MTRKRTLRRHAVSQMSPDMDGMSQMLSAEQTGNQGVLYPDGRPDISQVRNLERANTLALRDPRVYLPNPDTDAPFDRSRPQSREARAEAFGFQQQPDRLIDLPPGDAGAGQSMYRRTHMFSRLDNPATSSVGGNPMDKAIGMATYRSSDCRPRFWHISFFGIGIQRVGNAVALQPLSSSEILSQQLLPTVTGAVSSADYIPAITQLKGRVMVFDESGQRFYDVDIMGNRSLDVYAWGVTAFILAPGNFGSVPEQSAYEVNRGSGGGLPQTGLAGLVEDSLIGVRIVPIAVNSTQNSENRTITVITNNVDVTRVPIPPGTRKVQVISHEAAAIAGTYLITFDAGTDGTFAGSSTLGILNINAGESKSDQVLVPNSAQLLFTPPGGLAASHGWSIIFTVESQ